MNIFEALKKRHENQIEQERETINEKKQLNVWVSPEIIENLKRLAAEFAVPQYAVTAQVLETGTFYIEKALNNNKKKELLRQHLIDKHILGSGDNDPEELLRIGEGHYASEFILLSNSIVRNAGLFNRTVIEAKSTRNLDNVNMAEERLRNSALIFAKWVWNHPIDEETDEEEV